MPTIICPHCGLANRTGSNFCNRCGATLSTDNSSPPPVQSEETGPVGNESVEERSKDREALASAPIAEPVEPAPDEQTEPGPTPDQPESSQLGSHEPSQQPTNETESRSDPENRQPWLQPAQDDLDISTPPQMNRSRAYTGVQGLLEPASLDNALLVDDSQVLHDLTSRGVPTFSTEMVRQVRNLAGSGVSLGDIPQEEPPAPPYFAHSWFISLLVALTLLGAIIVAPNNQEVAPHRWPGVVSAMKTVTELPEAPVVLVNWAYDPATAGEMDLPALPVIKHLLEKQAKLVVASQLPGGPATARRLINRAVTEVRVNEGRIVATSGRESSLVEAGYLPGGAAVLPLLGQDPVRSVPVAENGQRSKAEESLAEAPPALTLVLAAQAGDVQEWLEQVQPLDNVPVIAVTGAGADPILRPYLDSDQLSGLVSGFDGAYTYQEAREESLSKPEAARVLIHIVAQEWGMLLLLALLVIGNLSVLLGRQV